MSLVVLIEESKRMLVIKEDWLENVLSEDDLNNGLKDKAFIKKKIFYLPNKEENPNFDIPVEIEFQNDKSCCYMAFIKKYFGKNQFFNFFLDYIYFK